MLGRRTVAISIGVLRQRADEADRRVPLEAVAAFGEIDEVGHRIRRRHAGDQLRRGAGDVERGESAGTAAGDHGGGRRRPALGVRMADGIDHVGHVELAPALLHRLLVGPTVSGGAAVVDHEHVPALRPPEGQPREERHRPLVGRPAVHPAQQPGRGVVIGAVQPGADDGVVARRHVDERRLDESEVLPAAQRPDGQHVARPRRRVVDDDLGRGARPAAQRDEPVAGPRQLPVHPAGDVVHHTTGDVYHAQPTEAALVARERHPATVRRRGVRPLALTPRRPAVLERLLEQRTLAGPHVQPTVVVAHRQRGAVGQPARLLHRVRRPLLGDRPGVQVDVDEARTVPRHVGDVPRRPPHRRSVRRWRRVEAEVGTTVVEPARRASGGAITAVERCAPHLALVDRVDDESSVGRHRRGERRTLRIDIGQPPHGAGRQRLQPQVAIARRVDHGVTRRRPAPAPATETTTGARRRMRRELAHRRAVERLPHQRGAPAGERTRRRPPIRPARGAAR